MASAQYRIIDLSVPVKEGFGVLLGQQPKVKLMPVHTHEQHGRSNTQLMTSLHFGTHIDPPYHFHKDMPTIDELPLEKINGPAIVIDLHGKVKANQLMTIDLVKSGIPEGIKDLSKYIVIVFSGWSLMTFDTPDYYMENPSFEISTLEWFIDQKIKAIGLDTPPDKRATSSYVPQHGDFYVHRTLLGAGIPIIENLVNIDKIKSKEFFLVAAPLKVHRGDGGPARVYAIEGINL